jgi:REP element-mobilizing transposase RayT
MNTQNAYGRARPPGAPRALPVRKKLPHERPLWLRPEEQIFFITLCCRRRVKNQLCWPTHARGIFDSIEFRNERKVWYAHLALLMPDHLHALIAFPYEQPMKKIVADWKRFLSTKLKVEWQRDFFDHRLRHEESLREKADYIRANPIRAGLVSCVEEWPYFWVVNHQQ